MVEYQCEQPKRFENESSKAQSFNNPKNRYL